MILSMPFAENTYVAHLEGRQDCVVVDPGMEPEKIVDYLDEAKLTPAAILLKQAAKIPVEKKKGGEVIPGEEKTKKSGKYKGFTVTPAQVKEIATKKLQDLNARDVDHACRIIEGTARSMGITVAK